MVDKKIYMEITDENDNVIKYEILLSFILSETKKHYIVYTDNTYNENNELNVYAAIYHPSDDSKLEKIETQQEWTIIKNELKKLS